MIEWSESDLAVREAVRGWIDKELKPHLDELETGQLPPYDEHRSTGESRDNPPKTSRLTDGRSRRRSANPVARCSAEPLDRPAQAPIGTLEVRQHPAAASGATCRRARM